MTQSSSQTGSVAAVAVVIVNYGTPDLTIRAVASLAAERTLLPNLRVVVVDGASPDDSARLLGSELSADRYSSWVTFLSLAINGGFGWANNQAILRIARESKPPEFIYLLNPDASVTENAVVRLVEELRAYPRCGAVGSQLLSTEGIATASAFRFPSVSRELVGSAQSEQLARLLRIPPGVISSENSLEVDWVTGASVMFRAAALQDSGLFDDGFFLYFDEVELIHRIRSKGWTVRHVPESRVVHVEGASTGLGAATAKQPHPAYWYRSRRRYFGLTAGRFAIFAAGMGALAGQALVAGKRMMGRSPPSTACRALDLARYGLMPNSADVRPSAPSWGDAPGRPPAWMARRS